MSKKFGRLIMLGALIGLALTTINFKSTSAATCPEVKIIFARGSGGERWKDKNYLNFKEALAEKLSLTNINYDFLDLDYPAVDVGNVWTLLTTYAGRGDTYEFGESVDKGVENLTKEIETSPCSNTKYVIAGYSQGAMVISKAVDRLDADKIIYAATFGDPKIYLPEGKGALPPACVGSNLSDYRVYVPDCRAYEGMLGSYRPYQPAGFEGKLGTWCNRTDFFCSSYLSVASHTAYVSDGLYEDASKLIFDKITKALGVKNNYISPHDTAILIDSTGSMEGAFGQYSVKASEIAKRTLESGGRVALYDYRDLLGEYEPRKWCDFDTCDYEKFREGLKAISIAGGGDEPESLLSASLKVMKELNWNFGSTKSLVILTDAGYHEPDLDGTTFDDVVKLSKKIDPVNFYVIVPNDDGTYEQLTNATDGKVMPLSILSDDIAITIMERYDSLPRVEEDLETNETPPTISAVSTTHLSDSEAEVKWQTNGKGVIVILNDLVLGYSEDNHIVLSELDFERENHLTLIPMGEEIKGERLEFDLNNFENFYGVFGNVKTDSGDYSSAEDRPNLENHFGLEDHSSYGDYSATENTTATILIPKAPNTGRR